MRVSMRIAVGGSVRKALAVGAIALMSLGGAQGALADECDGSRGQKIGVLVELTPELAQEVETLVMDTQAQAYMAPLEPGDKTNPAAVVKLPKAGEHEIRIRKLEGLWVFSTTSPSGETGTLSARLPLTMEITSEDSGKRKGGKVLMKNEWRLSSPVVATGIFAPGEEAGSAQALLAFTGLGNLCPEGDVMTDWRLEAVTSDKRWRLTGKLLHD